ncbi:MAG TPA: M4 family metallopeptidase [Kaistia sp.]|nr:M4 family metallopeptidase [Kaistia sp.]
MTHRHVYTDEVCRCCIVPPYILEAVAERGTDEQRHAAQQTLAVDHHIRSQRAALTQAQSRSTNVASAGAMHRNRRIYTASHSTGLPGTLVRSEGQGPGSDVAINEAYDGLGATFDLYSAVYGRNSIDDNGMDLIGTVHYGNGYNNAFWNSVQMVFGDGDGTIFNRFTIAIDVMGHELTHGVTGATAKLEYHDQPGALNESISDVFGSLVKQRSLGQTAAQADWLIGAGLLASGIKGVALRSMKAPGTAYDDPVLGKDPQPDHMSRYVNTTSDNGGVHINSGIPNKAFYLAAIGIGGSNAWDVAGKIWYRTLLDSRVKTNSSFQEFANLTADNANTFGAAARAAVVAAWHGVGIEVAPILSWQYNKSVLSTFTSPHSMNGWAYVQDNGWRKIQPLTPDGVTKLFALLVDSQAWNRKVHVYADESQIYQAYEV